MKIEEGDFRGVIRLATCSSDDTLADFSDETYNALLQQVGVEDLECPLLIALADFCSLVLRGDVLE